MKYSPTTNRVLFSSSAVEGFGNQMSHASHYIYLCVTDACTMTVYAALLVCRLNLRLSLDA